jgi:hypothetical protein
VNSDPTTGAAGLQRELLRQQLLLAVLWRRCSDDMLGPWLEGAALAQSRGLAAYRGNAAGIAERALGAAYPTIKMLLGEESFRQLARVFWMNTPPTRGDLAEWGDTLPNFVAADAQLASEPYLADVARVDWAIHRAESAADRSTGATSELPSLPPGAALIDSSWPVASIWRAHHRLGQSDAAFAAVREALASGRGEQALVWRQDGVGQVIALNDTDAAAVRALLGLPTRNPQGND